MADKKTLDVVLEKVGNQPLKTTKVLCGALGLGLAVAKGMVDKAPTTVAKGLDSDKAIALKKELEALGNTVSIPGMETKTEAPQTGDHANLGLWFALMFVSGGILFTALRGKKKAEEN